MRVQCSFKIINPDFNQEYANEYKDGKESESNWKYNWAVSYEVKDVESVELVEDGIYQLRGKKGEVEFDFPIPNVTIFRCHLTGGTTKEFAVSKSILNKVHIPKNEKYEITRCYFYINAEPESEEAGSLIIDRRDLPEQLADK